MTSQRLTIALVLGALAVTFASLLALLARLTAGADPASGMVRLLSVDGEGNLPAWFQSSLLLACAAALAVVAKAARARRDGAAPYWAGLAIIFMGLSLDETAQIHEMIGQRPPALTPGSFEFVRYAWLLPAGIALVVLGVVYARFLAGLPGRTRRRFLVAATLYLLGVFGLEGLGHWYATFLTTPTLPSLTKELLSHVEELLEMLGVIAFLRAVLLHLREHGITLRLGVGEAGRQA